MSDLNEWIEERQTIHAKSGEEIYSEPDSSFPTIGGYLSVQASDGFIDKEDLDAIVDAHNTLPALLTAVEKIIELHAKDDREGCRECSYEWENWIAYPCPTVQAIEGAINE